MGTGLTWDFAAASDRGILQRAQDGLDEEIASLSNKFMEAAGVSPLHQLRPRHNGSRRLPGLKILSGNLISPKSLPFLSDFSPSFSRAEAVEGNSVDRAVNS